jgi:hypothetical protein
MNATENRGWMDTFVSTEDNRARMDSFVAFAMNRSTEDVELRWASFVNGRK